jgi:hypothetical protein
VLQIHTCPRLTVAVDPENVVAVLDLSLYFNSCSDTLASSWDVVSLLLWNALWCWCLRPNSTTSSAASTVADLCSNQHYCIKLCFDDFVPHRFRFGVSYASDYILLLHLRLTGVGVCYRWQVNLYERVSESAQLHKRGTRLYWFGPPESNTLRPVWGGVFFMLKCL